MCVGSTSSGPTAAFGLPLRNGSISTRVPPALSSKQLWPRKRMSIVSIPSWWLVALKLLGKLPAHGYPYPHSHARLLGEQGADLGGPVVLVRARRRGAHLGLVRVAEPAALVQGLDEDALQLRGRRGQQPLGAGVAVRVGQQAHRLLELLVGEHRPDTTKPSN